MNRILRVLPGDLITNTSCQFSYASKFYKIWENTGNHGASHITVMCPALFNNLSSHRSK